MSALLINFFKTNASRQHETIGHFKLQKLQWRRLLLLLLVLVLLLVVLVLLLLVLVLDANCQLCAKIFHLKCILDKQEWMDWTGANFNEVCFCNFCGKSGANSIIWWWRHWLAGRGAFKIKAHQVWREWFDNGGVSKRLRPLRGIERVHWARMIWWCWLRAPEGL